MRYFSRIVVTAILAMGFTGAAQAATAGFSLPQFNTVTQVQLLLPKGDRFDILTNGKVGYTPKVDEHQGKDDMVDMIITAPGAIPFLQFYANLTQGMTSYATNCNDIRAVIYTANGGAQYQVKNVNYVTSLMKSFINIKDKVYVPQHVDYAPCKL